MPRIQDPLGRRLYANQFDLQNKAKSLFDNLKMGKHYFLLRYSQPVGVLLSVEEYRELIDKKYQGCQKCCALRRQNLKKK